MLSFLKEQRTLPADSEIKPARAEGQESSQTQKEDYLTVAGHGQKLKQSTILLVAVFVISGACVWMMIIKAAPSTAAAAQGEDDAAKIEEVIAQLDGMQSKVNSQMKNVTGRLNHLSEAGQIAVEDLKKNPFMRETSVVEKSADNPARKQFIEEQTRKEAAGFELWSITTSSRGICCMIDDKVLCLGDKINNFTVKKIEVHTVTIERDGVSVELKMN